MTGRRCLTAAAAIGVAVAAFGCDTEGNVPATSPTAARSAHPAPASTETRAGRPATTDPAHVPPTQDPAPSSAPAPAPAPAASASASGPAPSPAPGPAAVRFSSAVTTPAPADLHASWRAGCPVEVPDLRVVEVSHLGLDGTVRTGRLVVAAAVVDDVVAIMADLFAAGFPIQRMEPVEAYGGSDDASMAANNTSAFNCRAVTGGSSWSEHSYGRAVDVNPLLNPYVSGSLVLPPAGAPHADRSHDVPGMIHPGDEVVAAFAARGWRWGGTWTTPKDYQHFSQSGR